MKLFGAIIAIIFIVISSQLIDAQATHSLNIDIPNVLNYIKSGTTNFEKIISPNSQIYLPDTLTLYSMSDTLRMSASYDSRGWNNEILVQVRYSGYWVNYEKRTWTYLDATTESNLTLRQRWSNGQWQNSELDSSTYDANGNMLVHLFSYWSNGLWHDSLLSSRTYDANGNMLTNIGWVMLNNQWANSWRGTYTYDANGNELTFVDEMWSNGQWVNMNMWTFTYDGNGNVLTQLDQYWQNNQWKNSLLSTYTYDGNGNLLTLLGKTWDGQWTNSSLTTSTYDVNGYKINTINQYWSTTSSQWVNTTKYTYTNDQNGKVLNMLWQNWLNNQWSNYQQSIFTYDVHGNEITGYNTQWSNSSWQPADYDFIVNFNGGDYYFHGYAINISYILLNTTDVRTDLNTAVKDYSLSQNYPNPFNPSTTINFTIPNSEYVSLKVFDALGKEVVTVINEYKNAGNYSVLFNAGSLSSGIYFYQIQSGNFIQTSKLILLK